MVDLSDIPDSSIEQVEMIEVILIDRATGKNVEEYIYMRLRKKLMDNPITKDKLPPFVRKGLNFSMVWQSMQNKDRTYAGMQKFIHDAFIPLMEYLTGQNNAPSDATVSDVLEKFDAEAVHAIWAKALARRGEDPDGAITSARTLLETVLKHILDKEKREYNKNDNLPKLCERVIEQLDFAPDKHSEKPTKEILESVANLVKGIGSLRNKLSDSHGTGENSVPPSPHHASLAVNSAGAVATFMVEAYLAKKERLGDE